MITPNPGDRIRLLAMPDDPDPIPPGTTGTVTSVHPVHSAGRVWHQVSIAWDNGRSLMLAVPPDEFEVLANDADESG